MEAYEQNAVALHDAAKKGDCSAIISLLRSNADVDARSADKGETPLMTAVKNNKYDVMS
mgnify:CR=1 FL=1|tara:strand:+ start:1724 stop:1900 length:177 start_codon:yes stop_codon:yes gene_type:complete